MPGHYLNKCWLNTNWGPENTFEWNCDQSNFHSRKSIGNVVCKTEATLSRSQCVNNDNVAHLSRSGRSVDCGNSIAICRVSLGGVLWALLWTSPSSMLVPDHFVREGQHSMVDDSWTRSYLRSAWEICRQCFEFNNLSHMCAYSAILPLKIINDKSIKAIELSKIPRDSESERKNHQLPQG